MMALRAALWRGGLQGLETYSMGFRFYRRMKIAPGISLNFGKKGVSMSVGPRGAKMTFGPNGTRSSVGIPGTGIRYEKRYGKMVQGGGGDWNGKSVIAAIAAVLALVAIFAYQLSRVDRHNPAPMFVMVVSGMGSIFFWILYFILGGGEAAAQASITKTPYTRKQMSSPRYNSYLRDLASASQALYNFFRELNRSTRCRNQLKALEGLEAVDKGENAFSINKRLAAIAYCDLRSCFRKLGYDEGRLTGLTGIGYAMMILLLIDKDFDLNRFSDARQRDKLLSIVSELKRTATLEVDIEGHENEFRFALVFGVVNHEQELVQRFATHLYRWASLIAKADGTVTKTEGEALEAIMLMNNRNADDGNVRVSGGGVASADDIDLFAESTTDEKSIHIEHVDSALYSKDFKKAVKCIINTQRASTSHFQRQFGWGYNHAAKILDMLTERGVVSAQDGLGPRRIIMNQDQLAALLNDEEHGGEAAPTLKNGLEVVMQKLDELIGLDQVKKEVRQLTNFIEIQHKRKERGLKVAPVTYHCVFTGNPGTGKTTVARILADIFRELGVVKKGHLVETDRSGLVAEYVGQTAVKTNKVIDSALDGVLFIDEAYTLVQGGDRDYGGEAVATLLKRMEDDRGRLVVVLAGYTEEMKKFINSNPGLQSRFSRYIEFSDYGAEELARIFLMNAEKNQYTCDKDVRASIVNIMEVAVQNKDVNFGNARYVRNLFEKAIQRQAVRLASIAPITTEMLSELTLHDLGFAYED